VSRTRFIIGSGAAVKSDTKVKPGEDARPTEDAKTKTEADAVQTPFPRRVGAVGATAGTGAAVGRHGGERNALQTPSKEVQSALDLAIDRKIREDRERLGGWL